MKQGYLAIVLHAHLPFVRHPEHEESLEESWLYEAISDTYIPLLLLMDDLIEDGIEFRLTFSITPTLASMWADSFLQSRFLHKLDKLIELAGLEKRRTRSQPQFRVLAAMYLRHLKLVREAFVDRYCCNLIDAFKRLRDMGKIEIMASAATHAYLPLLSSHPPSLRAQIKIGVDFYRRLFGERPVGFWLPECGYCPGVDDILVKEGIRYSILETHGLTRASPRPRYGVYAPVYTGDGLAFFGRDPASSRQVWSSVEGYPGDSDYREFYRDIGYDLDFDYIKPYIHRDGIRVDTGFKYYRITGKTDQKEVYEPKRAEKKIRIHAKHFLSEKKKQIEQLASVMDRKPILLAPYDAELFGHWWFEGPQWLNALMRQSERDKGTVQLVTLSEYLQEYSANQVCHPSTSSWGNKGHHETWHNARNDWIYRHLHQGGRLLERLSATYPSARGLVLRALRQAARELLLAQASDWAFMMNEGHQYAALRTKTHLLRLNRLDSELRAGKIDQKWLAAVEDQDNIFPRIEYRSWS